MRLNSLKRYATTRLSWKKGVAYKKVCIPIHSGHTGNYVGDKILSLNYYTQDNMGFVKISVVKFGSLG